MPLKTNNAPSASGAYIDRFSNGSTIRTAFLVLHVLGFLAHASGVVVVAVCTELDAELDLGGSSLST